METLEQVLKMWESDAVIDQTEPSKELLNIPKYHSKYLGILTKHKIASKKAHFDYLRMRKVKWEYFTGKMSQEELSEYGWNDTKHLTWDATRVGADLAASFKIDWIESGDELNIQHFNYTTNQIDTGTYEITSATPSGYGDLVAWSAIATELNTSTDAVISKFIYNVVYEDLGSSTYDVKYIQVVSKGYSKTYDFESVTLTPNGLISGEVNAVCYNPTFDNVRIFKDFAEVEKSTQRTRRTQSFSSRSSPLSPL